MMKSYRRQEMLAGLPSLKQLDGVFFTNIDRSAAGHPLIDEVEEEDNDSSEA